MFNKFRIGAAGVALIAAFGMASSASAANPETADATAEILAALDITWDTSPLDFGTIAVNAAGTAVVSNGGVLSCTPTNLICTGGSAAGFTITGGANQTVDVTVPGSITLNGPGASTLTVTTSNSLGVTPTLSGLGSLTFAVGGSMPVAAAQAAGTYSNTFDVEAAYN